MHFGSSVIYSVFQNPLNKNNLLGFREAWRGLGGRGGGVVIRSIILM